MSGGWLPIAPTQSGAQTAAQTFPVGDTRTWSVTVANNLTGYTAEWRMGVPVAASLPSLLPGAYSPPQIVVFKSSTANLALAPVAGGAWALTWTTTYADTVGLNPALYWHQAVIIDPQGNSYTVAEGRVMLTPSLRATQVGPGTPVLLSPVVTDSFAIWQGDDTPPKVWSFGTPGNLADLTGSTFVLTVTGLTTPTGTLTVRSDTPGSTLVVNTTNRTVTWNYQVGDSAVVPASGASYQLHRLINGKTQLWTHGSVVGLS